MQDIVSALVRGGLIIAMVLLIRHAITFRKPNREAPSTIQLSQTWELQPGDRVAGRLVTGSLGDISLEIKGSRVYVPFDGRVQPYQGNCVVFSSDEVPAYLFRLCGLKQPQLGVVKAGEVMGEGNYLQFAALRKQPNGTWFFVEPSRDILERTLKKP